MKLCVSFNTTDIAPKSSGDVTLPHLGGLSVRFAQKILLPNDVEILKEAHSVVDLAFEDPSIITTTHVLLDASRKQRGEEDILTEQLLHRSKPNSILGHGGNERWLIPVRAVILAATKEPAVVDTTL